MTPANLGVPVAILAGGLATRLRPLTETVPKVMLHVAGRPFLEHQLESLRSQGVLDIVMCVGFLGETIEDTFGDGSRYGVRIKYSYDGPILLGTGGAIRRALPLLGKTFLILYGDSYLQIEFRSVLEAFRLSSQPALMTVFRNDDQWDKSNVHFADRRIVAYDKINRVPEMRHIDYGLSVLQASVLESYPQDSVLDLAEIMRSLALEGELAGYEALTRFHEIGSLSGLSELECELSRERTKRSQIT